MNIIENSRNLGNGAYTEALTNVIGALNILKESIKVFSPEYLQTLDLEDYEGLDDYEICYLELEDIFNTFNVRSFNLVTIRVGEGTLFESRFNTLFLSSLENFKFWYSKMKAKMDTALPINFETDFKERALELLKDLNYCLISTFQLYLTERDEEMQSCVAEYCAQLNINPVKFAKEYMDYFREHRPNQPLFIKYPEFLSLLETSVDEEFQYDLIYLSSFMYKEEILAFLDGSLNVDEDLIEMLSDRAAEVLSKE